MRRAFLPLAFVAALSACDYTPTAPSEVVGNTYRLISLQEPGTTTAIPITDPARYQVTFNGNGTLRVLADCNSCDGRYTISGSTLLLTEVSCTFILCGPNSLGNRLLNGLQREMALSVSGDDLTLKGGGYALELRK